MRCRRWRSRWPASFASRYHAPAWRPRLSRPPRGTEPPPRHEGAPELPAGLSVAEAFAHVVGHLSRRHPLLRSAGGRGADGPEPVHQMRVAVRRLRSAIKVFRHAVVARRSTRRIAGLKALAAKLAPTRDWDVFVTETGARSPRCFPRSSACGGCWARPNDAGAPATMNCALSRQRRVPPPGVELACLAGGPAWQAAPDDADQSEPALRSSFCGRCAGQAAEAGSAGRRRIAGLEPAALHAIRLRAKRLRYAAEIFAPLYPGKVTHRFIRRLSRLQDRLGALNDGAVAATCSANWERQPCVRHRPRSGLRRRPQQRHARPDRRGMAEVPPPGAVLGVMDDRVCGC